MARVTRSKVAAAAAATAAAEPAPTLLEPELETSDVINDNSASEAEDKWEEDEEDREEVPLPKRTTRPRKAKENKPAKTPARKTPSRRSRRGKKAVPKPEIIEGSEDKDVETPISEAAGEETPAETEGSAPEVTVIAAGVTDTAAPEEDDEEWEAASDAELPLEEEEHSPAAYENPATPDPEEIPEQHAAADESVTIIAEPTKHEHEHVTDEIEQEDEASISAELQSMADPEVDEVAIDTELERLSQEMEEPAIVETQERSQTPEQRQTVLRVAKTPKFDPEVHGKVDDFDVGNDSFELHISPKKAAAPAPSKLALKSKTTASKDATKVPNASLANPKVAAVKPVAPKATTPKVPTPKVTAPKVAAPKAAVTVKKTVKPTTTAAPSTKPTAKLTTSAPTARLTAKPTTTKLDIAPVKRTTTAPLSPKSLKRVVSTLSQASAAAVSNANPPATSASSQSQTPKTSNMVIPHNKPRPAAISFPVPPPPPKSTKPPTKSNFELPGDAFQRKIQAQREERRLRMEEEEKKRKELKAKPAPVRVHTAPHQQKVGGPAPRPSHAETARVTPGVDGTPEKMTDTKVPTSAAEKRTSVLHGVKKPNTALEAKAKRVVSSGVSSGTIRSSPKEEVDRTAQAQAVTKARKEAAERGRQTVKMWAEMQKQKEDKAKAAKAAAAGAASAAAVSS